MRRRRRGEEAPAMVRCFIRFAVGLNEIEASGVQCGASAGKCEGRRQLLWHSKYVPFILRRSWYDAT